MDFKKIFTFLIFLYFYIVIVSCGVCKPSDTVSKYLKAESKSDYDIAYELLSENDKKIKSLEEYKNEENAEFGLLFTDAVRKSTVFKILDTVENDESATVKVEITHDDYSTAISEMFSAAFSGASQDELSKRSDKMKNNVSRKTIEKSYFLIKENGQWVIFFDWEKENKIKQLIEEVKKTEEDGDLGFLVLKYDEILNIDPSNEEILLKKNTVVDKINYIPNIIVYDFVSKYYEQYFGGKDAGVIFKLKNNGNKELKKVQLTVYFKDNFGNIISEDKFTPISEYSWNDNGTSLKPNRIWEIERGSYYKADNVPSEWEEGSAEIKITDIEF